MNPAQFQQGQNVVFNSTEAGKKQGVSATIVRPLDNTEADIEEVGPMYKIKLDNHSVVDAFIDELVLA